jgi:SulP family sulfate permease
MDREHLVPDLVAGLTTGIADIPDAMASAVLAGANPVYGLYAIMIGKPIGGLLTSSHFMTLAATSAMALTAGSALSGHSGTEYAGALFTLALLVGLFQVVAGLLKLGCLMRFVSNAVMIGFLTGVSALVVLSQLGDLTGYSRAYGNKVLQATDLLLHLGQVQAQTLTIGLLTIVLILIFDHSRLRNFSMLLGMVIASVAAVVLGWQAVDQVADVAHIPGGLPRPILPTLSLVPELVLPALSLAIIGLVQGAGVSKAYPNPDGTNREQSVPAELASNTVTILHAYGNLFYAGAYKLEELLPAVQGAERVVVILRLRRSDSISSTLINVLEHYEAQLRAGGGKLMLAGVGPRVKEQLDVTETTRDVLGTEDVLLATENIGEATRLALEAAHAWLERNTEGQAPTGAAK